MVNKSKRPQYIIPFQQNSRRCKFTFNDRKQIKLLPGGWRTCYGLPPRLNGKESACNAGATGDAGSIPGFVRCPRGGNGNPLQYSCLENPMDIGAWWATVYRSQRVRYNWNDLACKQHRGHAKGYKETFVVVGDGYVSHLDWWWFHGYTHYVQTYQVVHLKYVPFIIFRS